MAHQCTGSAAEVDGCSECANTKVVLSSVTSKAVHQFRFRRASLGDCSGTATYIPLCKALPSSRTSHLNGHHWQSASVHKFLARKSWLTLSPMGKLSPRMYTTGTVIRLCVELSLSTHEYNQLFAAAEQLSRI